jgi:hypothetical protein
MKNDNNVLEFKDEGDFFTLKLTKDGKPLERGKLYPFGSLETKVFYSETECKNFAKTIGFNYVIM